MGKPQRDTKMALPSMGDAFDDCTRHHPTVGNFDFLAEGMQR
jgi:hypothetical protein